MMSNQQQSQKLKMRLTNEELEWAHQIKAAIAMEAARTNNKEDVKKLKEISDYEIAVWAIESCGSNNNNNNQNPSISQVLEKVYRYQCFLEHYKVKGDCWQEGMELVRQYHNQQPGTILGIDYMATTSVGNYACAFDYAKLNPKAALATDRDWRILMGAFFYMYLTMQSNLIAAREGVTMVIECDGMGFHNYDAQLEERFMTDLASYFPLKLKEMLWLRAPTVAHIITSILKPFCSANFRKAMILAGNIDGYEERLDKILLTPTPQIAVENQLKRFGMYLQERLDNQQHYRLPPLGDSNTIQQQHEEDEPTDTGNQVDCQLSTASSHDGDIVFDDDLIGDEEHYSMDED